MWRKILNNKIAPVNSRRRTLIKFGLIGGTAFVLGKVFGPSLNLFGGRFAGGDVTEFKNFRVVDNDSELGFYDKLGNEILIIEKEQE